MLKRSEWIQCRATTKDKESLKLLSDELEITDSEALIRAIMIMQSLETLNKKELLEIKKGLRKVW